MRDTDIALGLKIPVITDNTDGNGVYDAGDAATAGDHPERLGAITLTLSGDGADAGAILAKSDGTALVASGGSYTIAIITASTTVDTGLHVSDGLPTGANVNYLTATEYENLIARPAEHRHENFQVGVSVTSYEVDDSGVPRVGVDVAATSTQEITVYVQAVTDDAALLFNGATVASVTNVDAVAYNGDNTVADVTLKEDTTFNVKSILSSAFQDRDGSEVRSITITNNTGQAILLNGTQLAAGASRNIGARAGSDGQTGDIDSFPNITIGAVGNFSGDLNGIGIRINAQDGDSDGYNSGNVDTAVNGIAETDTTNNSVTLNLRVTPVAGDVEATDVTTNEDTPVAFLAGVRVTDTGTGAEVITQVEFTVPTVGNAGGSTWVVAAPDPAPTFSDNGYEIAGSGTGGTYTITFNDDGDNGVVLSREDRETVLDGFTIRPPAHSSADATISLSITTADTQTVGGSPVTDTATVVRPVAITVTPVAEREDTDSAGPAGNDVTHNDDYTYTTEGAEDTWFTLGQEGGFNLKTNWGNEDGDEHTYALLTPRLIGGDGSITDAMGSQLRYSTNGITTEAGGAWTMLTFNGTSPVEIPIEYLDTLQFKAAKNFSGKFEIDVRVKTVDYDDDSEGSGTPSVYISEDSVALLDNILILPVADQVTLAVHGLTKGDEDSRIPLTIEPRSDDKSETYTVVIENIPAGARLFYGNDPDTAVELPVIDGAVTIANFDSGTLLTVQPPPHSNSDFVLTVNAKSVDTMPNPDDPENPYVHESLIQTKTIQVQVKGVVDGFELQTDSGKTYAESLVDGAMNNRVPLSELITGHVALDTDGSETLNLKITLPAGFSLEGGTWLGDGWLLDEDQLAAASIRVPEHFSGQVVVGVAVISTESDGHSTSEPTSVTFAITPEVEKAMQDSSALLEDTRGQLQFTIPGGGDTKETLTSVWIDAGDVATQSSDYTLYYGSAGNLTLAAAASDPDITDVVLDGGWYKLSGNAIGNIHAQGAANSTGSYDFGVEYTIVNTATNGPAIDTSTVTGATHTLTIAPVTDPATLVITGISSSNPGHADIDGTDVEVTGNTTLTIDFQLTKSPDGNAGDAQDHDGSERLTGVVIEGVPQGVTIVGASYIGNVPGGDGSENTGRWLLPIDQAIDDPVNGTTFSIEFELLASADILTGLDGIQALTVTAITRDGSADEETASASWTLTTPDDATDFDEGDISAIEPAGITGWTMDYTAAPGVEDEEFELGKVLQWELDGSSPFAITITGFSGGSISDNMTETTVNGVPTWTLYGSGDSEDLQDLLDAITIKPPVDHNDNHGPWTFDVTLTTYAPNGERNVDTRPVTPPLAPATDPAAVTVTTSGVTEGDAVTFNINVERGVDGTFSEVVDGKLYLQLSEAGSLAAGTLTGPGGPLVLQAVAGVDGLPDGDYYVIEGVGFGDELTLTYQGGEYASGQVSLSAGFLTREAGAEANDILPGSGGATAVVAPRNSGIDFTDELGDSITELTVAGTEDQRVELKVSGALHDQDGSEALLAAFLRNVPSDFLVFVGSDEDGAKLANNAGGGTWSIPLAGGALPAYIAVQPPRNWSGTASDLELVIQASDQGLAVEDFILPVTLVVEPVADGISISPTLTFGTEGDIIPINLNAAMLDNDGSEVATLTFQGLGQYAAFYAGATLLDAASGVTVVYDEGTDTHTVSGLSPQQVDTLGFVQAAGSVAATVHVTAYTVDGADSTEGSPSSGSFDVSIAARQATAGHDVLLYGGVPIDGLAGDDTIQLRFDESLSGAELDDNLQNIERIDMTGVGINSITSLRAEDVFGMTDTRNTIRIDGDSRDDDNNPRDSVRLDAGSGWSVDSEAGLAGYTVYLASHGADTVRLEIANGIHVE